MADKTQVRLDAKNLQELRVVDLKKELEKRGLSRSGSKKDLVERLKNHLQIEKLREESSSDDGGGDAPKVEMNTPLTNPVMEKYLKQREVLLRKAQEEKERVQGLRASQDGSRESESSADAVEERPDVPKPSEESVQSTDEGSQNENHKEKKQEEEEKPAQVEVKAPAKEVEPDSSSSGTEDMEDDRQTEEKQPVTASEEKPPSAADQSSSSGTEEDEEQVKGIPGEAEMRQEEVVNTIIQEPAQADTKKRDDGDDAVEMKDVEQTQERKPEPDTSAEPQQPPAKRSRRDSAASSSSSSTSSGNESDSEAKAKKKQEQISDEDSQQTVESKEEVKEKVEEMDQDEADSMEGVQIRMNTEELTVEPAGQEKIQSSDITTSPNDEKPNSEVNVQEQVKETVPKPQRKRRWGKTAVRQDSVKVSTSSLKDIMPDVKVNLLPTTPPRLAQEEEEEDEDVKLDYIDNLSEEEPEELMEKAIKIKEELQDMASDRRVIMSSEPDELEKPESTEPERQESMKENGEIQVTITDKDKDRKVRRDVQPLLPVEEPQKIRRREASPSLNPVSKSIHIYELTRPFTVGQLKEVLSRYGRLDNEGFWIDTIKSHCIATYETEDQAIAARKSLHNTVWPSSNPKVLKVDFTSQKELDKVRGDLNLNPLVLGPRSKENREKEIEARRARRKEPTPPPTRKDVAVREWDRDKIRQSASPPRERERRRSRERRDRPQASRDQEKKREHKVKEEKPKVEEQPAKLLDDLFHKTKATPCLYWLPLTMEVAESRAKFKADREAENRKRMEEREKREEEERKKLDQEREKRRKEREQELRDRSRERRTRRERRRSSKSSPSPRRRH